ncbi:MAG: esterase/lipase family protein [Gammaproteobacteria bacterium]
MTSEPYSPTEDEDNPFAHDPSVEPTLTPLWREAGWPFEWMRLRTSAVYFGCGIPRGHGEPVLLIPGFMAGDALMLELHRWLKRIGYRSYLSNIAWNNDCPDRTARMLATRLHAIRRRHGRPVRLVGHSLGGMLAKSLLQDHPGAIDRIVTLGSPFRSLVKAHPAVVGIWDQLKNTRSRLVGRNLHASCGTGHCLCSFVKNLVQPEPRDVPQFAIYSRKDGVADWSSCIEEQPSANTEVDCTHIGMVVHPEVFRAIAVRLAERTHPDRSTV